MDGGVCWHVTCSSLAHYCRRTRAKTQFRVGYRIMGNHQRIWKEGFDIESRVIEERGLKNKLEHNVSFQGRRHNDVDSEFHANRFHSPGNDDYN